MFPKDGAIKEGCKFEPENPFRISLDAPEL